MGSFDRTTEGIRVSGASVSAISVSSSVDLWPTARWCEAVNEAESKDWCVRVDQMQHTVRVGVMQMVNTSGVTGENWHSASNVGSVIFLGGGIFSGNQRQKSSHTSAVRPSVEIGDAVGVHVRGKSLSFSKNGQAIPGSVKRCGTVFLAIQLGSPGDQATVIPPVRVSGHSAT